VAAEGLIAAYATAFQFQAYLFRFVSILGERYTHGHVFDFYRQLLAHPERLDVLGNGLQRKSYLYVQDCVSAILTAAARAGAPVNIFNLGTDQYCQVNESIGWITRALGLHPDVRYAGGERGWVGDSPFIFLDCSRMRALGWSPQLTIEQGIVRTLEFLRANPWVLEKRR
jgi:UDP-glucose 4-epimerase